METNVKEFHQAEFELKIDNKELLVWHYKNSPKPKGRWRMSMQPKDDENCHKAFLMLAHLKAIEDYINGL